MSCMIQHLCMIHNVHCIYHMSYHLRKYLLSRIQHKIQNPKRFRLHILYKCLLNYT